MCLITEGKSIISANRTGADGVTDGCPSKNTILSGFQG